MGRAGIRPEQAGRYQLWLQNDKRLHDLVCELETLAIPAAQAAEGWGCQLVAGISAFIRLDRRRRRVVRACRRLISARISTVGSAGWLRGRPGTHPIALLKAILHQREPPVVRKPRRAARRCQRPLLFRRGIQREPVRLRDEHRAYAASAGATIARSARRFAEHPPYSPAHIDLSTSVISPTRSSSTSRSSITTGAPRSPGWHAPGG